jgi:hypothetical protein
MTEIRADQPTTVIRSSLRRSAAAEFNPWTYSIFPASKLTIDKFEMPSKWHDIIKLCYYFYEREGLVRSVIDKQVEIGINGILITAKSLTPEEVELYKYVANNLTEFLSVAATEYYISGLIVPDVVWGTLPKLSTGFSKDYVVPVDVWIRDPTKVELKETPLPNHIVPLWTFSSEETQFILSGGKYSDGTEDIETFELIKKNFPDVVAKIKRGELKIPLNNKYIIRRKPLLRTPYPVPYLMAALELLLHKRNLRAMDYALISRVIDAILHIKVGNDEYPLTENDDDILDALESEFNSNSTASNKQRVFQLFTNHTVELEWVIPPLEALLNTDKYDEINREILYGLGFPKFLVTGEKDKSNTGSSSSAMLSPVNSMKALRKDFINFIRSIFYDMAVKNSFSEVPTVSFAPMNLMELSDLLIIAQGLETSGVISKNSLAEIAGFDFTTEQYMRVREKELQQELFPEEVITEEVTSEDDTTEEQLDTESDDDKTNNPE